MRHSVKEKRHLHGAFFLWYTGLSYEEKTIIVSKTAKLIAMVNPITVKITKIICCFSFIRKIIYKKLLYLNFWNMSRFRKGGTFKFEIGDGDWIEFKNSLGYEELSKISSGNVSQKENENKENDDSKIMIRILFAAITSWNLKNEEGGDVPITEESLSLLNIETFSLLVKKVNELYYPEKKDLGLSAE